jgi:hypothetical protein
VSYTGDVFAHDVPAISQASEKSRDKRARQIGCFAVEIPDHRQRLLLRPRCVDEIEAGIWRRA